MRSSAKNSSVVHWCRHRIRFNKVPEKDPKVPEKVWEALVQSQVRFNRVAEKVPEKAWVQSQVRFNRVPENGPEKVPQKVWEALVEPRQVQQGSGDRRRFRKFPEGFAAEPGRVQRGSRGFGRVGAELG